MAVVVLVVILGGLALTGFVGVSPRQLALELPRYQSELGRPEPVTPSTIATP